VLLLDDLRLYPDGNAALSATHGEIERRETNACNR
jgi:hypothetical protein